VYDIFPSSYSLARAYMHGIIPSRLISRDNVLVHNRNASTEPQCASYSPLRPSSLSDPFSSLPHTFFHHSLFNTLFKILISQSTKNFEPAFTHAASAETEQVPVRLTFLNTTPHLPFAVAFKNNTKHSSTHTHTHTHTHPPPLFVHSLEHSTARSTIH
jgi:hypothetical protein